MNVGGISQVLDPKAGAIQLRSVRCLSGSCGPDQQAHCDACIKYCRHEERQRNVGPRKARDTVQLAASFATVVAPVGIQREPAF